MKRKSLLSILAVFMLAVMALSFSGCSDSETIDYVASVKQMAPYESSGISATYGTVLDKYISSCEWQERVQSEELAYVDASGKITDMDGEYDIAITFKVTPYEGKTEGMLHMVPYALEVGEITGDEEAPNNCISELFDAYELGFDTYAEYLAAYESGATFTNNDGETFVPDGDIGKRKIYDDEVFGNMAVTLEDVEFVDCILDTDVGSYLYPDDGCVFLYITVTVENIGNKDGSLMAGWNKVVFDNSYEFNESWFTDLPNTIMPLTSPVTGHVVFEVPTSVSESDKSLILNFGDAYGNNVLSYVLR